MTVFAAMIIEITRIYDGRRTLSPKSVSENHCLGDQKQMIEHVHDVDNDPFMSDSFCTL